MEQKNFARNGDYLFLFGEDREITYHAQNANISSVGITPKEVFHRGQIIAVPGDNVIFDPLQFDLMISEDFSEWIRMYKWIMYCNNKGVEVDKKYKRCVITPLDSNNKPLMRFVYKNCLISNLGGFEYTSKEDGSISISVPITIEHSEMQIETLDGEIIGLNWNGDL